MSSVLKSFDILMNSKNKYVLNKNKTYDMLIEKTIPPVSVDTEKKTERQIELLKKEAEEHIKKAHIESERIIKEAQIESKKIKERAWEQGFSVGSDEGRRKIEKQYQSDMEQIRIDKKTIQEQRELLYHQSEEEMIALAIDIAKKIIGERLEEEDDTYIKIARNVLNKIRPKGKIQLRVNSRDYEIIINVKGYLLSILDGVDDMDIIKDESLKRGDCIIDTGNGIIDGGVDTQIELIEKAFDSIFADEKHLVSS